MKKTINQPSDTGNWLAPLAQLKRPFGNYQGIANYYEELRSNNPDEANRIQAYLINHHIPRVKTNNETLIDLVCLAHCDEALAKAVFDRLVRLMQKPGNDLFEGLGALMVCCDALQAKGYSSPSDDRLIELLMYLSEQMEGLQSRIGQPIGATMLRLLAGMNSVLNVLLLRALSEDQLVKMGKPAHEQLNNCMTHLKKNIEQFKDSYPWLYFLSQRAMAVIEAIEVVKTAVERGEDRFEALKALGRVLLGLIGVAAAVATAVTTFGAGSPIMIVAIIAFGATFIGAVNSSKDIIMGIRGAYNRLSQHQATSLNWFQVMSRSVTEGLPELLDWETEVAPVMEAVLNYLNSDLFEKIEEIEKLSMIYFLTMLMTNTKAPQEAVERVRDQLVKLYCFSQSQAPVQLFVLDAFFQLRSMNHYQPFLPDFTGESWALSLLGSKPQANANKKQKKQYTNKRKRLDDQIQTVKQEKTHDVLQLKSLPHGLAQEAWFQCYPNDRVLVDAKQVLERLIAKRSNNNELTEAAWKEKLVLLRTELESPAFRLGLEDPTSTSQWGQECYQCLLAIFGSLQIEPKIQMEKSVWKIYGMVVNGNFTEVIGVQASPEQLAKLIPNPKDRSDFLLASQKQAIEHKFRENVSGQKEEVSAFIKELMTYVHLEVGPEGKVVAGNANFAIGLQVVSERIRDIESESASRSVNTLFWQPPPLPSKSIPCSDETKESFAELKEVCEFTVELIGVGQPKIRITAIPKTPPPLKKSSQLLMNALKEQLLADLKQVNLFLAGEHMDETGLVLELQGSAVTLKVVHAWLCQVAEIDPPLDEADSVSYPCRVM